MLARSRFLIPLLVAFVSMPACAAGLININTADEAALETLPGIGTTKASAIIAYRSGHGPFARPEDLENVSGIGPATYANIASRITVAVGAPADAPTPTASSTETNTAPSGGQTYVPPPAQLRVSAGGDQNVFRNVPVSFAATVRTGSGGADPEARIQWSFGDGSAAEGTRVTKTYQYPGTYVVDVSANDGSATASDDVVVTVTSAQVRLAEESAAGIRVANDSDMRLNLSGWRLWAGSGTFRVPSGTIILPKTSVLFPTSVTNLPVAFDARLYYPDGQLASQYGSGQQTAVNLATTSALSAPASVVQLRPSAAGLHREQTAYSAALSTLSENHAHGAQAVGAPAVTTTVVAAGALYVASSASSASVATAGKHSLLSSPWVYGFLGVVAAAAGALVLL